MPQESPGRPAQTVQRVVVTGASGNVGTALLRRLAREGVAVSAVARRVPAATARPAAAREAPAGDVRWHAIDVTAPWAPGALREAMAGADAVVHLAWKIQPSHDRAALRATNVEGTRAVVAATLESGVPHLVHTSSVGVYAPVAEGTTKAPVDETWPRTGVPTSSYSRDKVAAEDLLDDVERDHAALTVARLRPGLVLQREAGGEIARYFGGPLLPAGLVGGLDVGARRVRALPALPLPDAFVVPVVHADDLADAFWLVLAARAAGAFNAAADQPLGPDEIASALGARRRVRAPVALLRRAAAVSWRARLQPTDPGWVDLAAGAPVLDSGRLRRELGWAPVTSAAGALDDLVAGLRRGEGGDTPPLARRGQLAGRRAQ